MIQLAYTQRYTLHLPEGHRFPIQKYALIKEQLLYEGTATEAHFYDPGLCHHSDLLRVHSETYVQKVALQHLSTSEVRQIGLPQNEQLYLRSLSSTAGTLQSALHALRDGLAMNLAGGTHHAFHNRGEGFCVFNDIAVAAAHLLHHKLARRILIVDLDVHQGNGTASIFAGHPQVFTFSVHGANNYPLRKEKSHLDLALPDHTPDAHYLEQVEQQLRKLVARQKPDIIFFQAGVDVLASDLLGKLSLSKEGCRQRDQLVANLCYTEGIPLAVCMGGGYSARIADVVEAHCNTFRVMLSRFEG